MSRCLVHQTPRTCSPASTRPHHPQRPGLRALAAPPMPCTARKCRCLAAAADPVRKLHDDVLAHGQRRIEGVQRLDRRLQRSPSTRRSRALRRNCNCGGGGGRRCRGGVRCRRWWCRGAPRRKLAFKVRELSQRPPSAALLVEDAQLQRRPHRRRAASPSPPPSPLLRPPSPPPPAPTPPAPAPAASPAAGGRRGPRWRRRPATCLVVGKAGEVRRREAREAVEEPHRWSRGSSGGASQAARPARRRRRSGPRPRSDASQQHQQHRHQSYHRCHPFS